MQFKVPQFLDIEDKIFGPFTFRQFVYLAGGAGLCYTIFKLLGFMLSIIPILIIAGFAIALAFYRPNGKPFIDMVQAGFRFFFQDKLYVWQKRKVEGAKEKIVTETAVGKTSARREPKLSGSKLRDLAWSLDVLDLKK